MGGPGINPLRGPVSLITSSSHSSPLFGLVGEGPATPSRKASILIRFCWGPDSAAGFLYASATDDPAVNDECRAKPTEYPGSRRGKASTPLFVFGMVGVVQKQRPPAKSASGLTFVGLCMWVPGTS